MNKYNLIILIFLYLVSCGDSFTEIREERIDYIRDNNVICYEIICRNREECISMLADGVSKARIFAFVPLEIESEKNKIVFSTNIGTFASSNGKTSSPLTAEKIFTIDDKHLCNNTDEAIKVLGVLDTLKATSIPGISRITITVDGISRGRTFHFINAEIESISLKSNKFAVLNTALSEAKLTAAAKREIGTPSKGQKIDFKIQLGNGEVIDDSWKFRDTGNKINESAEATTTFTVGNIDYTGELLCIACVDEVRPGAICDTLRMEVLDDG